MKLKLILISRIKINQIKASIQLHFAGHRRFPDISGLGIRFYGIPFVAGVILRRGTGKGLKCILNPKKKAKKDVKKY